MAPGPGGSAIRSRGQLGEGLSRRLEVVLRRYVAYAKLIGAVRRKTLSALMYPAVLVAVALGVVSVIEGGLPGAGGASLGWATNAPTARPASATKTSVRRTWGLKMF